MKHTPLTAIAILSLALVGCGATQAGPEPAPEPTSAEEAQQQYADELRSQGIDPTEKPEVETAGHGTYRVHAMSGAEIEFELPTDPSHEDLAAIEQYRQDAEIDPVTYIVVDVDNRHGTDTAQMNTIAVYDPEGNEYEFEKLERLLVDWSPYRSYDYDNEVFELPGGATIDETTYRALEEQHDAIEDNLSGSVSPAARSNIILVYEGDDLPDEFTRIATWPHAMSEAEDAYLVN